jgi:hypothetical protein
MLHPMKSKKDIKLFKIQLIFMMKITIVTYNGLIKNKLILIKI